MCLYYFVLLKSVINMKKILFAIVCLFVVSLTVSAQQGQGNRQRLTPEESAKQLTETLKTELNLTAEQVTQVQEINLDYAKEFAKLRENANGDFSSLREPMQKLEEKRVAAYEKVLTDEQLQAYKKFMEERRQRGPGQGGGRRNN